jgi:hypothetical protein
MIMTPRALLTTIGTTAVAFAIAIVVAASSVTGAATTQPETAALAAMPHPAPAHYAQRMDLRTDEGGRMASWNEPCETTL